MINNEEHLLRALADTGASSSIMLEAYTSAPFMKTDDNNTKPGVRWVVSLLQLKLGYYCDIFTPRVKFYEKNFLCIQITIIQQPRVQWVVSLLQLKLGYYCDIFTPRVKFQE
jgi:hypothetical protein